MSGNFLWPLLVVVTGFLAKSIGDAIGLNFEIVFANMGIEHCLVFAYLFILGCVATWEIMNHRQKKIVDELKQTKESLSTYEKEDEEIANLRAIIRHQNEDPSIKA